MEYKYNKDDKAERLIDYIIKVNEYRNKPVRNVNQYEQCLWFYDIPHKDCCHSIAWDEADKSSNIWISIKLENEPKVPSIPEVCKPWMESESLTDKNNIPKLLRSIKREVKNKELESDSNLKQSNYEDIYIENFPDIKNIWDQYVENEWNEYITNHNIWENIYKFYYSLYEIHMKKIRLGGDYELVIGFGLLTWDVSPGYDVKRHLITVKAELEFEASEKKFIIRAHSSNYKAKYEIDMLDIQHQPINITTDINTKVDNIENPWTANVSEILKCIVNQIDPTGEYSNTVESIRKSPTKKPCVDWTPAVILRKRSHKGLTNALENIREQLKNIINLPYNYTLITELSTDKLENCNATKTDIENQYKNLYFPKPSNEQQRSIAERIESGNGILVQGPPGTGKSHTIANLICHLLATGKRTLITAKTERALQVLNGLIPESLQPLCISMLGEGNDEQKSLEKSISAIDRECANRNKQDEENKCNDLENDLNEKKSEKAEIERRIAEIRKSENDVFFVACGKYHGNTAEIARRVKSEELEFNWFTDNINLESSCPIANDKLYNILDALRKFTDQDVEDINTLRSIGFNNKDESLCNLLSNEEFKRIVQEERNLSNKIKRNDKIFNAIIQIENNLFDEIYNEIEELSHKIKELIKNNSIWIKEAINNILNKQTTKWESILEDIENIVLSLNEKADILDNTIIEYPKDEIDIEVFYNDVKILNKYLKDGGKLKKFIFLTPDIVQERIYIVNTVRMNGYKCNNIEQLDKLEDILSIKIKCSKILHHWDDYYECINDTYKEKRIFFSSILVNLQHILYIRKYNKLQSLLIENTNEEYFLWNIEDVHRYTNYFKFVKIFHDINILQSYANNLCIRSKNNRFIKEIKNAISSRNIDGYEHALFKITELLSKGKIYNDIFKSLDSLAAITPKFVEDLKSNYREVYWNERVTNFERAWHFRQAKLWVEDYINKDDLPRLEKRIFQLDEEITETITDLAATKAWIFCLSRLTSKHRKNMQAWKDAIKKLGKGTGINANKYRRAAQEYLNESREAIPAYIMPLHRVWDTVQPVAGGFDIIIIDEASQCGLESLPLLFMGKKIIVVGDDKQISPQAVGIAIEDINALQKQYLYDYRFKDLFDANSSLFEHCNRLYDNKLTLREHFRSMPEIIQFSNELCYSDTPLIPLRQYCQDRLDPLKHIYVENGFRSGDGNKVKNIPEANLIVQEIHKIVSNSQYDNKTIGVISLQGGEQARIIERELVQKLSAEEIEKRKLLCGDAYSFQGDERDIILLSLVAAPDGKIGTLSKATDEQRFNVAASRARDQMILFHSVKRDHLGDECVRRKLLTYFEDPKPRQVAGIDLNTLEQQAYQEDRSIIESPKPFDSWFEVDIALELLRKKYNIIPQYKFAGYSIDLVVNSGSNQVAIECDGDYWHSTSRQIENDLFRQRQLERCGWKFFRIRSSEFYYEKDKILNSLLAFFEDNDIFPFNKLEQKIEVQISIDAQADDAIQSILNSSVDDDKNSDKYNINIRNRYDKDRVVMIGDTVVFIDINNPNNKIQVTITTGESRTELGFINAKTPVAQALLDEGVGSIVEVLLPSGTKNYQILEIR